MATIFVLKIALVLWAIGLLFGVFGVVSLAFSKRLSLISMAVAASSFGAIVVIVALTILFCIFTGINLL